MVKKQGLDVHAPVEDVEVPSSLKILVIFMVLCLLALMAALGFAAVQSGILSPII